jgi:tripartite-type tricarboxylate transporter receptor subunit TctC
VASSQRSPALPDVPTIGESLKGFEADSWFGIMVPAGTPRDIIAKLNAEVQKTLASQEVKDRLLAVGGFVQAGGPEQFATRLKSDIEKWGKVARAAKVRIE